MPHEPTPLSVVVVGYGFGGRVFHAPLVAATPGLSLDAIVTGDPARREQAERDHPGAAIYATAEQAWSAGHDLAAISTANVTHVPFATTALAAGMHVVLDKPVAATAGQAAELAERAADADRLLVPFQNRRWDSDYLGIKQVIDGGLIGEVAHFESHIDRFRPSPRDRWRENPGPGSGLWFDLGPHLADQALQLFGLPEAVTADFGCLRAGSRTDDWAHVILDYPRRRVVLHGSMLAAGAHTRFIAHGTAGTVVKRGSDIQEDQLKAGVVPGAPGWGEDSDDMLLYDTAGRQTSLPTPPGNQLRYYRELHQAITGQGPNPVLPRQILSVMAVIDAGRRAAQTGCRTELALSPQERQNWNRI